MTRTERRPLRADAERTVRAVLEAAEGALSQNPNATMGEIAAAAGVARTTVHRRFASREELVNTMAATAIRQINEAVDAARVESAPPPVALHQSTVNALRVKLSWRFAMSYASPDDPAIVQAYAELQAKCDRMLRRAQDAGLLGPDVDLEWARRVYYALVEEALQDTGDVDRRAARVVDTLLHGLGPRTGTSPG